MKVQHVVMIGLVTLIVGCGESNNAGSGMAESAKESAESVTKGAGGMLDQVKESTGGLVDQAKESTGGLVDQAKDAVGGKIAAVKEQKIEQVKEQVTARLSAEGNRLMGKVPSESAELTDEVDDDVVSKVKGFTN